MLAEFLSHRRQAQGPLLVEQSPQRCLDAAFALVGRQLQDAQVLLGSPLRLLLPQQVVGQAEAAGGEQVSPVARPLFATPMPTDATTPAPECGGPASATVPVALAPSERILPEVSTFPDTICAIAASTFAPFASRFVNCVRCATVSVPEVSQLLSGSPG